VIKSFYPRLVTLLLVSLFCLTLSACTQTVAGPSAALKKQFSQLQKQQRQQAEQLAELQQQLAQLRQQPLRSTTPVVTNQTLQLPKPVPTKASTIPAAISREVTALADSASSYLAAFSNLAAGRYAVAETGFSNFLSQYPEHQYSTNARYWLASAQVFQGNLQAASSNLRQVIVNIDGQERAPAALALLAKIYQQQQMNNEAERV